MFKRNFKFIFTNINKSICYYSTSKSPFVFRQLFDNVSSTYTYILGDTQSKEAIIIDPVIEHVERDSKLITELDLNLKFAINTHMHADHITGTGNIKQLFKNCKSMISKNSGAKADIYLNEGDKIEFGNECLDVLYTPGHTNGCLTYVNHKYCQLFTGDTLLIRGCGRTDFQEGSPENLYISVHKKIFTLPDYYSIYPAHDYKGVFQSTVGEEKNYNPRLTKSLKEFIEIMNNLNLAKPKMIDVAVPANKVCGLYEITN